MRGAAPRCPRCAAPLVATRRWFGLIQHLRSPCPACGADLVFDTAGGVHLKDSAPREEKR
ncbi:hypothetical protein [Maliponia aquimaris]|uniref:Uncharacterized protein n=1 Tax=Maliponia aquimaris TaxID=1673631 RepID=A0A238K1P3_9RHOB|nr:hypothetical protein [Maliponia aquimaris]SMX36819.1 hypothetical protein MAA8898_01060 [Maliponia aquimaris]